MKNQLNNVVDSDWKRITIEGFNKLNNSELDPNKLVLNAGPADNDNDILLMDPNTKQALLVRKINISDVIPTGKIDLSGFGKNKIFQTKDLTEELVEKINSSSNRELVVTDPNVDNFNMSSELKDKFKLFCSVVGFYFLDITDVILSINDNVLTIEVVQTNKMFCGKTEVFV